MKAQEDQVLNFFHHYPYCTAKITETCLIKQGLSRDEIDGAIQTLLKRGELRQPRADCLVRYLSQIGDYSPLYYEHKEEYGNVPFNTMLCGVPFVDKFAEGFHKHTWHVVPWGPGTFYLSCERCGAYVKSWKGLPAALSNVLEAASRLNGIAPADIHAAVASMNLDAGTSWDLFAVMDTILRYNAGMPEHPGNNFSGMTKCPKCGTLVSPPMKKWTMVGRPDKAGKRVQLEIGLFDCSRCKRSFRGIVSKKTNGKKVIKSKILRKLVTLYQDSEKLEKLPRSTQVQYKFVIDALSSLGQKSV